jgi:hypothetical protein
MAHTITSDLIVPEIFTKYVQERTATTSAFFSSGVVSRDAKFDALANGGGKTVNMPFFQDLSGDSEITPGDGTTALTVNRITADKDIAAVHLRSKAWGANDVASALTGADPMGAIVNLVGDYWAREFNRLLIKTLTGAFLAASMSGKTFSYFNADVTTNGAKELDGTVFIDAIDLMGDASDKIVAVGMHSYVRNQLWKKDLIDTVKDSEGKEIDYYMGRRVIIDDSLPKAAVTGGYKYTTYLFGAGAVAYGEGNPENPVEMDREILKRNSALVNDKQFLLHPRGVAWAGTAAGDAPSDSELIVGTNWLRKYEAKNVRIVQVITNG